MNVHRPSICLVQRLISKRIGLSRHFLARNSSWSVLSPAVGGQTQERLLFPVQTSCNTSQVRWFSSEDACTEHGTTDCPKCSKEVSLEELTQLVNGTEDVKLVDVREAYELRDEGAIPKAINIPLKQLRGVMEQLKDEDFERIFKMKKPRKDEEIIFSCKAGVRSKKAMSIAEELGFTKARHFPGGWQEWSKSQEVSQ